MVTDSGFWERLESLIGTEKREVWARRVGLKPSTIYHWRKGGKPGPSNLQRIAASTGISIAWLLSGEGPQYSTAPKLTGSIKVSDPKGQYKTVNFIEISQIPLIDLVAGAGGQGMADDIQIIDTLYLPKAILPNGGDYRACILRGDSMSPRLCDGDVIVFDQTRADIRRFGAGLYVANFEGGLVCKNMHVLPGGILNMLSENPAYPTVQIDLTECTDFRILGKVVKRWTNT